MTSRTLLPTEPSLEVLEKQLPHQLLRDHSSTQRPGERRYAVAARWMTPPTRRTCGSDAASVPTTTSVDSPDPIVLSSTTETESGASDTLDTLRTVRASTLLGALLVLATIACGPTVDSPDPPPEDPAVAALRAKCPAIVRLPRFCLTAIDGSALMLFSPDDGQACGYKNVEGYFSDRASIAVVGGAHLYCEDGTIYQYSFSKRIGKAYTYNNGEWFFIEDYGAGMLVTRSDNPNLQFYRSPPDPGSPWLDLWNTSGDEDLPVTVPAGRPFAALPGELWVMAEGASVQHYELPSGILLDSVVLDLDEKDAPEVGFDVTADRRIVVAGRRRVRSFDAATGALLSETGIGADLYGLRCWPNP